MGTGKIGRYLNTYGDRTHLSQFALVHSTEGTFNKPNGHKDSFFRLMSGGHGQKNIDLLTKYHVEFNIVGVYENGVRVGNVPLHKTVNKTKGMNQSWFPETWGAKTIVRAGEYVARMKEHENLLDGEKAFGMYKGVRVGIILTHGKIATVFPDSQQPCPLRRL